MVFLALDFAPLCSAGELHGEGGPGVEISKGEDCGFSWFGAKVRVETDESIVGSETSTMTKEVYFLFK